MFSAMEITRFRGFPKVRLDPLARFNLVIGRNNVGKTALLEAAFLLLGPNNPELPLRVNGFRGIELVKNDPEDLWGWLFYKKDFTRAIEVEGDIGNGKRQLYITLRPPKEIRAIDGDKRQPLRRSTSSTSSTTDTAPAELLLKYRSETGGQIHTRAFIKENGLGYDRAKPVVFPTSVYIQSKTGGTSDNSERFSKLEEIGQEGEILPALRILEPRLKRLAVLVTTTGPMIHGEIGIGRMVPVPFMGEGMGRLLTLLLSITTCSDGVVLVDEIEGGLHYSVMKSGNRSPFF